MNNQITIGIDNGTSGTFAMFGSAGIIFDEIPVKDSLLGKAGKHVKRVDHAKLAEIIGMGFDASLRPTARAYVERPFTGKFANAVLPGQRAFESVLIVLEQLGIGYEVIDSKEWQNAVLGAVRGSANLKKASFLRGQQFYPVFKQQIADHGDADGLLIAHYYHLRRS